MREFAARKTGTAEPITYLGSANPEAWPTQFLESGDVATFTAAKRFLPGDLEQEPLPCRKTAILSDHKTLTVKEEATRPKVSMPLQSPHRIGV